MTSARIAVLIPCYNEEKTIGGVVRDFRSQLPGADIYVFDNNSTDNSVGEALKEGGIVRHEKRQGKGNVIQSMFKVVDADIYVMVDGDGTYPADSVHDLVRPIASGEADMVIGSRLHHTSESHFKPANRFGNRIFLSILNSIFKVRVSDLLSGYRAFNRNIVKSLPLLSGGFEIETELTIKGLDRGFRIEEVPINLTPRPEGSESKIKIFRDGFLIINTIFALFRDYKPLSAFGFVGLILLFLGLIPGAVVISEFVSTGLINRLPSAVLSVGLILSGLLVAFVGLILHTISRRFREIDHRLQRMTEKLLSSAEKKTPD